ncbi:MAG TPA: VOC family protein [Acidimicrobiales bacterium]
MADTLVQVIFLVTDLEAARRNMREIGLTVLDGGRHPGRGTANLIVPFGRQYLELLAIVDERQAQSSPQGRPVVAALSAHGPGLARWSVEAQDIEATAGRVGYPIERRQRVRPDGTAVTWRSVAVDTTWTEPWRCAFMAWDDPGTHPARAPAVHRNGATGFARLDVVVPDIAMALDWMGGAAPSGVVLGVGPSPGPAQLSLSSPGGDIPIT